MKTKRLLSALALACLLPLSVLADVYQDPETKVNYEYEPGSGVASVKAGYSMTGAAGSPDVSGAIVIRQNLFINDVLYEVKGIGDYAFANCRNLTSASLPETISNIGYKAFYECRSLEHLNIPNSLVNIGIYAFGYCLKWNDDIVLPNGITKIEDYTFSYCGITSIAIPPSVQTIGNDAFDGCSSLSGVYITDLEAWCRIQYREDNVNQNPLVRAEHLYLNGEEVTEVTIPEGIETLSSVFDGGKNIKSIIIPNGVTKIGNSAFGKCSSLSELQLPESVTNIGNMAFSGCTGLTSLQIPQAVTSIGYGAFLNCSSLTNIKLPAGITEIGSYTFEGCSNITEIDIPNGVKTIGAYAFSNCGSLSSIILPTGISKIEEYTFEYCTSLTEVAFPEGVTSIGEQALSCCEKIETIYLPSSIKDISGDIFYGCGEKTINIHLADLVPWCNLEGGVFSYFKKRLFHNGEEIIDLIIPEGVTKIRSGAFTGYINLRSVHIPSSVNIIEVSTVGGIFPNCDNIENIYVSEANTTYDSRNNCNAIIETTTNNLIRGCRNTVIPDDICSIGTYAFYKCKDLSFVKLPQSLISIGNSAFVWCTGLQGVEFPTGLESIGSNAFYGCTGLVGIVLPNSVSTIGNYAFMGCTSLEHLTLPNSLNSIGKGVFQRCSSLNNITSYLTSPPTITNDVFSGCYTATLYVPYGTAPLYKAATGWKSFTNIVEMEEEPDTPIYQDGDVFVAETEEGIELRYTVISAEDKTCMLGVTEPVGDEWEPTAYTDGNYYHSLIVDGYYSSFALTLPEVVNGLTVVGIGEHALANSTLSGCNIPSTVTFIGDRAFYNTEISNFTVPASVTSIGWNVVSSINLQAITVEGGNEVYDSRNNCNAIIETATNTLLQGCNSTIIPDDIEAIAYWSLASADKMKELNIPKTVTSIGVMGVPNLEVITVDEENPVYDSRDNCNAIIETSTNTLVVGCKNTTIPETVVAIGDEAFESTSLESIFVPGSVKSIGNGAFYCFNLKEVTLAEGVEYIGESAFIGDGELETITIPSTVTYIGSDAFAYCSKGKTVTSYIITPFDVSGVFRFFGSSQEEPTTLYVPYGTKAKYEAAGGWDVFDNIVEMDCDLIVMEKAMQTYTSSYALDFSTPVEGLKAYTLTAVNDKGKAVLTEVTGAVPAGTGLVLMGTAGEQYAVPCVDGALESGDNLLVGVTADTEIGGNDTDYILKDGKFVKAIAGTLPAGKAYLKIDAASAREVIEIEGATTGIGNAVWAASSEGKVYNLNGQRVSQPMRGLYIVNGKKVIK